MSSAQPSSADLQAYSEKLQAFYHNLPDLPEDQPDKIETEALEQDVKKLDVKEPTLEDKVNAYCQEFLYIGGPAPPRHRQHNKQDTTST